MVTALTLKHRVDHLESLVDLLAHFGASEDDLAADKDEQHHLRLEHAVDQARKQLWLVRAKVVMARCQAFETDRELDVAGADNVLDLEVRELGVEAELLDDASVLARRQLRVVLRLGTCHHHLARGKDERCCLGFANAHDDGSKPLNFPQCVSTVAQPSIDQE